MSILSKIIRSFSNRPSIGKQLVEQQQYLLHNGLLTTAEVIDLSVIEEKIGHLIPIEVLIKLQSIEGEMIYLNAQTLISIANLPKKGDTIRIKYLPSNRHAILIVG